jgi:hypothetical protein
MYAAPCFYIPKGKKGEEEIKHLGYRLGNQINYYS